MNSAQRADTLIPAASQTYSKSPSQFPANAPRFALEAQGALVLGSDMRWYTDWTAALGPIVLGYKDKDVTAAVHEWVDRGSIFGLPTELEGEVAEQLVGMVPCAERVRFGKNGSDVTAAAIRAARSLTGRDVIASYGYHGWQVDCPNPAGIPEAETKLVAPLGVWGGYPVAAVIVEPDSLEAWRPGGLKELRETCNQIGALLIFDEVLTGFRLALGGAQQYFDVVPDLACFAKAMANGYSCSAVVGSAAAMEPFGGRIGYSMTFAGETIGLAAAAATLRTLREKPVVEHLWRIGAALQDGWNAIAAELELDLPCVGLAPRSVIRYPSLEVKTLITQEMWRQGEMFTVGFTPTWAHTDLDVERALASARVAMKVLANCANPADGIEGPVIAPVFRKL